MGGCWAEDRWRWREWADPFLPGSCASACVSECVCVPSQRDAAAQKVRESLPESL